LAERAESRPTFVAIGGSVLVVSNPQAINIL
jgi:hypothetical protein